MALKLITATEIRNGTCIMIDGQPCIVRSYDISKTGKHGASKLRADAIGVFDGKKRVVVVPGHERFEIPMIKKLKAQVMSVSEDKANIMDLESFETFDVLVDAEIKADLKENDNVEYWDIEESNKIIKRRI